MGGMSGFNMMYPYAWFASGGDAAGDVNFAQAAPTDGNFFNDQGAVSGSAHPASAASTAPPAGTVANFPLGTYAGYVNSSVQSAGMQSPLQGGPALMMGPTQGPQTQSNYAAALPRQYTSAAPPWKNGPLQYAVAQLPAESQAAVQANSTNPAIVPTSATTHHTNPAGVLRESPAKTNGGTASGSAAPASGGCAGCSGGCGGKGPRSSYCRGRAQQAVGLDSTNDFPPLYSHYQATQNQVVNASLYSQNSTHVPAWATAQGTAADTEIPLQGQ